MGKMYGVEKEAKLYTRKGKGNKIIHKKGKRKQNYI